MLSKEQILKQFERHKSLDEDALSGQHKEAATCHDFVAGDKMHYVANVNDKASRPAVVFNKVKPYVDGAVGFMIQLRRKPVYEARLENDMEQQTYSIYANSFSDYARDSANLSILESFQDREMIITGYGAIDTNIGYEKNPDGEVMAEVLRYDDVYWDNMAQAPNLLDARWVRRRKSMDKEEVKSRFPNVDIEEFETYETTGKAEYNPNGGLYTAVKSGGSDNDLLQVHYYQWWELVTYYRAENPALSIDDPMMRQEFVRMLETMQDIRYNTSEVEEQEDLFRMRADAEYLSMTPTQKADVAKLCEEFGVPFKPIKQNKRCYYTALITGKVVLDAFKSLDQNGFTIKFKTAFYDPKNRMWYGMVRGMKNPQEYANKALTEMLFTIASNSKGGVMYEEDAVDNPARFEQQYASTRAAIRVRSGALGAGKIQPKAQSALPTGYENIHAMAETALTDVTGISKEFLGTSGAKQNAALLESQRINQVQATLACYFDAISLYQTEHARLMLTFMRILAENSAGRLIRIVGETGAAAYRKMRSDMLADEYDVVISEAPTTAIQRENTAKLLMEMAQPLMEKGINIYQSIVSLLNLTPNSKELILQAFKKAPEAEQQQAQAQNEARMLEIEMNKAIMDNTKAQAARSMADAQVKLASLPKIAAEVDKTYADTALKLEETASTAAQVEALNKAESANVRVTL
jgi:hypothetical protein